MPIRWIEMTGNNSTSRDCADNETQLSRTFRIQIFNVTKAVDPDFKRVLLYDRKTSPGVPNTESVLDDEHIYHETVGEDVDFIVRLRSGVFPVVVQFDDPLGGQPIYFEEEAGVFSNWGAMAVRTEKVPFGAPFDLEDLFGMNFGGPYSIEFPGGTYDYYETPSPVTAQVQGNAEGPGCEIHRDTSQIFGFISPPGTPLPDECQGLFSMTLSYAPDPPLQTGSDYVVKVEAWDYVGKVDEHQEQVTVPAAGPWSDGSGDRAEVILNTVQENIVAFTLSGLDGYRLESIYDVRLTIEEVGDPNIPIVDETETVLPLCGIPIGQVFGVFEVAGKTECTVLDGWGCRSPK